MGYNLTCPVEFSMTCTSGILVDIFERLEVAKKKGGERNGESRAILQCLLCI